MDRGGTDQPASPEACPCGVPGAQPWRTRDALFSPASFIGGVVVIALGTAASASLRPIVGAVILAIVALAVVVAFVVQYRRGHRGACLVRRALWIGVATPGAPVRLLATLP